MAVLINSHNITNNFEILYRKKMHGKKYAWLLRAPNHKFSYQELGIRSFNYCNKKNYTPWTRHIRSKHQIWNYIVFRSTSMLKMRLNPRFCFHFQSYISIVSVEAHKFKTMCITQTREGRFVHLGIIYIEVICIHLLFLVDSFVLVLPEKSRLIVI